MKRICAYLLWTFAVLGNSPAIADEFTVPVLDSTPLKGTPRSKDTLTLSGHLEMIPMDGMTVVLIIPSMGQIIIGKRYNLSTELGRRIDALERARTSIEMKGVVLTFCTEAQMKKGTLGCRMFDPSRPVAAKTL